MGNDASWGVNQAVKNVILNDEDLQNCFRGNQDVKRKGFCYSNPNMMKKEKDDCQNETAFIHIGKVRTRTWKSLSFDGQSHDLHLNILDKNTCNDGINKAVSRIITLFHDCELKIQNHAVVEFQFEWSETAESSKGGWQAELCFHALTVSD